MNLSKSKYCNAVQCLKMLWLDANCKEEKSEASNKTVLDNGEEVGILAKDIFGPHKNIEFNENLKIMLEETNKLLDIEKIVITEASFIYNNNFCSIDILKKDNNNFEVYEVKSSTQIEDIYIEDISYQVYILKMLGHNVSKASIIYLNSNYERVGDLDLKSLFIIEDVTDIVLSKQEFVKNKIEEINNTMSKKIEPNIDIGLHCFNPYECPFFKYCTKHLKENNIFKIRMMRNSSKFKLYKKGIYKYEDLLKEDIDWKYKEQIEFELYNKKDKIEIDSIKEFMNSLTYPIYFLDFETYQQAIPMYDHIKPYMQIPFQYSLHYIEQVGGQLKHKEFLATPGVDAREELAKSLVRDIPRNVCVLAYNMSFEKTVIKNLSTLYEELNDKLMNIHDNIKDLMIPFKNRNYYTKQMQGSFSIKYVLPALFPNDPTLDYHNLELVHNGSEAMSSFLSLKDVSKEEREHIRYRLLKYCELDTYAMVKIWMKLKEIIESSDVYE